jgi:hypothetical protein
LGGRVSFLVAIALLQTFQQSVHIAVIGSEGGGNAVISLLAFLAKHGAKTHFVKVLRG